MRQALILPHRATVPDGLLTLALALTLVVGMVGCSTVGTVSEEEPARAGRIVHDGEQLVYVGYGRLPENQVTGAISQVSEFSRQARTERTVMEMLEGRVAGVDVVRRNGRAALQIRGPSTILGGKDPLYVVDGMPVQPGPSGYIGVDPYDVESIEVLKDAASTAMYGIRGANGVVVITTK